MVVWATLAFCSACHVVEVMDCASVCIAIPSLKTLEPRAAQAQTSGCGHVTTQRSTSILSALLAAMNRSARVLRRPAATYTARQHSLRFRPSTSVKATNKYEVSPKSGVLALMSSCAPREALDLDPEVEQDLILRVNGCRVSSRQWSARLRRLRCGAHSDLGGPGAGRAEVPPMRLDQSSTRSRKRTRKLGRKFTLRLRSSGSDPYFPRNRKIRIRNTASAPLEPARVELGELGELERCLLSVHSADVFSATGLPGLTWDPLGSTWEYVAWDRRHESPVCLASLVSVSLAPPCHCSASMQQHS